MNKYLIIHLRGCTLCVVYNILMYFKVLYTTQRV
jgi:hypothetical protein